MVIKGINNEQSIHKISLYELVDDIKIVIHQFSQIYIHNFLENWVLLLIHYPTKNLLGPLVYLI